MSQKDIEMFGMDMEALDRQALIVSCDKSPEMVVANLLSDAQTILNMGDDDAAHKMINVAKYFLFVIYERRCSKVH